MPRKNVSRLFALTLVAGLAGSPGEAQNIGLLDTLVAYDQAWLSNLTVDLTVSHPLPAFDPIQGSSTSTVTIVSDGTQILLSKQETDADPLLFCPDQPPHKYDADGNYVLSHVCGYKIHLGPKADKVRIESKIDRIAPQGSIVETRFPPPLIEVHPPGNLDAMNRVYRYLLPLGRGYSSLLTEITQITETAEGFLDVTAKGHTFSIHPGIWNLVIDPAADYLVREATFSYEGSSNPSSQFGGKFQSGVSAGTELPVWNAGFSALTDSYRISVTLNGVALQVDTKLLDSILTAANTVPPNATLRDYLLPDASGLPLLVRGIATP